MVIQRHLGMEAGRQYWTGPLGVGDFVYRILRLYIQKS